MDPNNVKGQVDYIFKSKKWIDSVLNCLAFSSFEEASSDHTIVTAKICMNLDRNKIETVKTTGPYLLTEILAINIQ